VYIKNKTSRENRDFSAKRLSDLEEREKMLEASIDNLSSDEGVEEELRKNFDIAKDGEGVIRVVDKTAEGASPTTTAKKAGFWSWLNFDF
jgi:cell division protein FtsB